jgi:hypothetical protein
LRDISCKKVGRLPSDPGAWGSSIGAVPQGLHRHRHPPGQSPIVEAHRRVLQRQQRLQPAGRQLHQPLGLPKLLVMVAGIVLKEHQQGCRAIPFLGCLCQNCCLLRRRPCLSKQTGGVVRHPCQSPGFPVSTSRRARIPFFQAHALLDFRQLRLHPQLIGLPERPRRRDAGGLREPLGKRERLTLRWGGPPRQAHEWKAE